MDSGPTIGETPHPVSAHERIDLIDVVRGFRSVWRAARESGLDHHRRRPHRRAALAIAHRAAGPDCQAACGVFRRSQVLHAVLVSLRVGVRDSAVTRRGTPSQRGGSLRAARVYPRCHRAPPHRARLVWRHLARLRDRWVRAPGRSTLERTTPDHPGLYARALRARGCRCVSARRRRIWHRASRRRG